MDEKKAKKLADILNGQAWQSGGGIWLVLKRFQDGRLVVISEEAVCEYASEEDFESGSHQQAILLV